MNKFLLLFFLLFAKVASGTIVKGSVKSESGEALPFTSVYIKGTTIGTTSNADGNFSLSLQPGTYELAVKYIGYQIHYENIIVENQPLTISVRLKPDQLTLHEVVVKASGEDPA